MSGQTVLLVEDNEANRDLSSRYLAHFYYEVTAVTNGQEALGVTLAPGDRFDVILVATNLTDIDSAELAQRLKSHPRTRQIPLIALTAHAMVGDRERFLSAGYDECVTKPINFARLIETINSLCNHGVST